MLKLCLVGGLGRMGRSVASLVERSGDFTIASILETEEALSGGGGPDGRGNYRPAGAVATSDAGLALDKCDVVVDFSLPEGFDSLIRALEAHPRPLVTGTTGIRNKGDKLAPLARRAAVVSAPNMSVGVNIMFALAGMVAELAGGTADIEIVEAHHRTKKDVPSGTALEIAERIRAATGREVAVGRAPGVQAGGREVFVHSLRMGGIPGDHAVLYSMEGEVLKIEHRALSRECFAAGALRAAAFAAETPPGIYSMLDVLKLKFPVR
jgi:4-hydroxy-tetrahydrodipicolinate reductase